MKRCEHGQESPWCMSCAVELQERYEPNIPLILQTEADKFELDKKPMACIKCGELQNFTVPFKSHGFEGFISDHVKCGEEYRQMTFTFIDKLKAKALGDFVKEATKDIQ
jgi:hypothetical protein